jgi:hypothetical protein
MSLRYWRCAAMHDKAERRGLWYLESSGFTKVDSVVIVAGREGNDDRFEIQVGETMTQDKIDALMGCLQTAAWVQEDYRGYEHPPFFEKMYVAEPYVYKPGPLYAEPTPQMLSMNEPTAKPVRVTIRSDENKRKPVTFSIERGVQ